jgi:hypothetical protein
VEWKILQLANSNLKQINRNGSNTNPYINGVIVGAQGSHHGISMGNVQPLTSLTLGNLSLGGGHPAWDIFSNTENVKKYEVFETTEDILALSVTWHRLRPLISHGINNIINPTDRPTKLTDSILFKELIQEDRDKANVIRDYYSKKLMVITLREQRISKFRKDLSTFIHGDSKVVKEELMPIIYRLPEFYEYDISFDEMVRELNTRFEFPEHTQAWSGTKTLKPIKKFIVKLRINKFSEYWLKDDDNKLCKIEIPLDNKLNHLWEHFFEQDSVPLEGLYKHMERDGISYFHLKNWEIDFAKI